MSQGCEPCRHEKCRWCSWYRSIIAALAKYIGLPRVVVELDDAARVDITTTQSGGIEVRYLG